MKIRSVKLREAHKTNGVSSFCSILWDLSAEHIVTSSSSDSSISVHDFLLLTSAPKTIRYHKDGVTALALSSNSTCLASGSIDHSVKLYKFPGGEFETNITRFTLPIRVLAFNISGRMLAAAGDDDGIKLINTVDGNISRLLKGHMGSVTGLAFDPNSEYLASIDSFGTVIFWELNTGKALHTLKGVAPVTGSDLSTMNVLSWSPDGDTLAVPGLKNDVVMYDRDTAERVDSLRGDHVQPICFLSWSPNGKYIATSSLDRQVLIWDVKEKQGSIVRQKFDEIICCMAWKPNGNALAVIDVKGKYGVWDSVIPSSMKSPTEDPPTLQSKNSNGLSFYGEEVQEPSASDSLSDFGEASIGESEPHGRKRSRKYCVSEEISDEDVCDKLSPRPKVESGKKGRRASKQCLENGIEGTSPVRPKMQDAFQSGATLAQAGKRRFLCYNMLGSITTIEHDGYSHIEIDFHDTSRGPRVPSMTDRYGFTMASLNENGSVFANPCKGEKMSTLMYRPFSSWASNSEWHMRFEGEEVKVVALGTAWVAAITNLNFLRIFTEGGLQRYILSLDGPVVTASGFRDKLAIVIHASHCLPSDDQMLEVIVFNISNGTQPFRGRLPLSPGSCLTWFGFSEEGELSSYDSKGVLRVFKCQLAGSWLPLFSASKERKSDEKKSDEKKSEKNYWIVGLNATKLFCIVCDLDIYPQVMPKPVLTLLDLSFPLASSDLSAEALENEFILNNMHLTQIVKRIEEMETSGLDTSSLDDEAFTVEAAQDRCILRLIASCCNGDKLVRATELVKLLTLEKSVKGAIKLVTALKLPSLAERFNVILEERMVNESRGNIVTPILKSNRNSPIKASGESSKKSEAVMPIPAPPPKLTSPAFTKKAKLQEGGGEAKTEQSPRVNPFKKAKKVEEIKGGGDVKKVSEQVNEVHVHRPTNPFAKEAPNNREKPSSLFDDIKKLKKVDNASKR